MNFTGEIRRDLLREFPKKECCRLALLCGALDAGGVVGDLGFSSENEETAAYLLSLFEQAFGFAPPLLSALRDPRRGRDKLTFSETGERARSARAEICAQGPEGLADCCKKAYLIGAFLGGGSCTLPKEGKKTGFHLEFVFPEEEKAEKFRALLEELELIAGLTRRGERSLVYVKSREAISDFLYLAGARGALKTLEEISLEREERNGENRRENCYAGNADKAAIASAAQVVALEKLRSSGRLSALSPPLKEAAQARLEHPELSLSELSELLGVSKSCLNHRLRKLMSLSRT